MPLQRHQRTGQRPRDPRVAAMPVHDVAVPDERLTFSVEQDLEVAVGRMIVDVGPVAAGPVGSRVLDQLKQGLDGNVGGVHEERDHRPALRQRVVEFQPVDDPKAPA